MSKSAFAYLDVKAIDLYHESLILVSEYGSDGILMSVLIFCIPFETGITLT